MLFYQGPTHRLESTPPDSEKMLSVLRLSDLSTDEEDAVHCKINKCEKKIDSLMHAVGTLKNEVRRQCGDLLAQAFFDRLGTGVEPRCSGRPLRPLISSL